MYLTPPVDVIRGPSVSYTHLDVYKRQELISMDYYGPLITSTGGVKYILVIIDNFTKYVKLYALKRATTRATINRLKQYIASWRKPLSIVTDNGTQFTTNIWTRSLRELGIKPKFTAIRNLCTNIAERTNRQLGNLFRVFVKEKHSNWAKYIPVSYTHLYHTLQ